MNIALRVVGSVVATGSALLVGVYLVAVFDRVVFRLVAHEPLAFRGLFWEPVVSSVAVMRQGRSSTERPDAAGWAFAPALLAGLAAVSLVVIPVGPGVAVVDTPAGLVLFGAAMALVLIAVFLHGWSPNSVFPLMGAYRFVAQALSFQIPFFLVLIAVALPAESLAVGEIVQAQASGWNVWRQPLGLPIYLLTGLGVAFWGPLATPDAEDLAGGTLAEVSGTRRVLWRGARAGLLVSVAAMGAAAFLGGWTGPWIPGPLWVVAKTLILLALLVSTGHVVARVRLQRFVMFAWIVLLPLALLDVFFAGILLL